MTELLYIHTIQAFDFIFCTVQPGHRGIVYSRLSGLVDNHTLDEGLNFVVPWFQRVIDYDTRSRPQLIQSQSGSKDLQIVQISLRVLFRPDPTQLPFIYRRLGRGASASSRRLLHLSNLMFIVSPPSSFLLFQISTSECCPVS